MKFCARTRMLSGGRPSLPLPSPLWKRGALGRVSGRASGGGLSLLALGYCSVYRDLKWVVVQEG